MGFTATWKDETAHISFYFEKNPTELELEEASDICTEIIASRPKGMKALTLLAIIYELI